MTRDRGAIRLTTEPEPLRDPVLVAAFQGWNDAGEAATGAVGAFMHSTKAMPVGDVDPEDFYDFQVNRPLIAWRGTTRTLEWPTNRISTARLDGHRDAVFLQGIEPNLRWRTFADVILQLAADLGVRRVITLGALQVDVPHTRAVPLTGSAGNLTGPDAEGLVRSGYEGPTGIVGVLHQAAIERGLEAVTLWVGVPHYLAGTAYHRASLRLAERAAPLMGLSGTLEDLERDAAEQSEDIAELLAEDEDLAEYVQELERQTDADGEDDAPMPEVSGEEIAADFERYLRDQGDGPPAG